MSDNTITEEDVFNFLKEVDKQIAYIEEQSQLIRNGEIPPTMLNYATAKHHATSCWILKMYESEVIRDKGLQTDYKIEWSSWIKETAKELNQNQPKSKFASASEIEANAILNHRDEYRTWQKKLIISDRTVSLYRRLTENWKGVLNILITLSSNSRADMKALGIENIVEYEVKRNLKKKEIPTR